MGTGGRPGGPGATHIALVVALALALTSGAHADPGGRGKANGKANGKAKGQRPVVASQASAKPNEHGWYRAPVTGSIWVARPSDRVLDACVIEHEVQNPDGTATSSQRIEPGPLGTSCRIATRVTGSRIESLTLRATRWRWSATRSIRLRVDLDAPGVEGTADAPRQGAVRIQGTVTDAFSGPLDVVLVFTEDAGRHASFREAPACDGCGEVRGCTAAASPPCGGSASWSLERALPAGSWTVTPIAHDLAGNEATGDAMHVVVPATTSFRLNRPRIDRR